MATAFFNISFSNSTSCNFFFSFNISSLLVTSPVDVIIVPYFFIHGLRVDSLMAYSLDKSDIFLPFS